jgi:hypothetical protein
MSRSKVLRIEVLGMIKTPVLRPFGEDSYSWDESGAVVRKREEQGLLPG